MKPTNLFNQLSSINDPRREILLDIYKQNRDLFHFATGSQSNHQVWQGGYADHISECLTINDVTYDALSSIRPLGFTKESAAICLFFHDIEKPYKYAPKENEDASKWAKEYESLPIKSWDTIKWKILDHFRKTYNFDFTDEEINALKYTHGEGADYKKGQRVALPLAAHVHHCDNTSARIWFDQGKGIAIAIK